jgi:hypothetical protein
MKKVGIVTDNYKIDKFKQKLIEKGFMDFEFIPAGTGISFFKIMVADDKVWEINKICQEVELHFKRSN